MTRFFADLELLMALVALAVLWFALRNERMFRPRPPTRVDNPLRGLRDLAALPGPPPVEPLRPEVGARLGQLLDAYEPPLRRRSGKAEGQGGAS